MMETEGTAHNQRTSDRPGNTLDSQPPKERHARMMKMGWGVATRGCINSVSRTSSTMLIILHGSEVFICVTVACNVLCTYPVKPQRTARFAN